MDQSELRNSKQIMASFKLSEENTASFIEYFQGLECLWNISLEEYHKKEVKRAALRTIAERMSANHEKEMTGE